MDNSFYEIDCDCGFNSYVPDEPTHWFIVVDCPQCGANQFAWASDVPIALLEKMHAYVAGIEILQASNNE